jgi:peptidoglycan hydrolase-like protein with peptidoglycan-binding domain
MIVGSGPLAPSAEGMPGYVKPRPQIDYPDARIVYLNATSSVSTTPPAAPARVASSTAPSFTPAATSSWSLFPNNEQLWDAGAEIRSLQKFLNTHGFPLVSSGRGSPGNETEFFDALTYAALAKFQAANGLPATGFLGPLTRAALASTSTTH